MNSRRLAIKNKLNRSHRRFFQLMALGVGGLIGSEFAQARMGALITKPILSSNERIPMIGLGSSRTFIVGILGGQVI